MMHFNSQLPFGRAAHCWLFCGLIFSWGIPTRAEVAAVVYRPIVETSSPPWRFKIAFWQDPDASDLSKERTKMKVGVFAEDLLQELGTDLVACGFGDLEIYLINDYEELLEERGKGEFHLLHCDQAAYLMGRLYPSPGAGNWDPYTVLVEEVPSRDPDDLGCGVWVRQGSEIESVADLEGRHIAIVDDHCLLGGVLQKARLAETPLLGPTGFGFQTTDCGSTSDAILRLMTGLATEEPITAAFLPLRSPGVLAARRALDLKKGQQLPIRLLERFNAASLPGRPLLASPFREDCDPALLEKLATFFVNQRIPYRWRFPDPQLYENLEEELAPLFEQSDRGS